MTKKSITINIRLDEDIERQMRKKAETFFGGNISALIRCASITYSEEVTTPKSSEANSHLTALMTTAIKKIDKIGVNLNQVVKAINEKKKLSPLAFTSSDMQPFNQFSIEMTTVQEMLRYLYEIITNPNQEYDCKEAQ